MKLYKPTLIALSFLGTSLLASTPVEAQALSYSLSPPITRVIIKPGVTTSFPMRVHNYADPAILKLNLTSVQPSDEFGTLKTLKTLDRSVQFKIENSSVVLNESFILKSNEDRELKLSISIPDNASLGDHYYALTAENQAPAVTEGIASSAITSQLSSYIFVSVTKSGATNPNLKIIAFDTLGNHSFSLLGNRYNIFDSAQEVPIVLVMQNSDTFLTDIEGQIYLKGIFGDKKSYNIIPAFILSNGQKTLVADQSISQEKSTTLVLPAKLSGIYTLETNLQYGQKTGTIYQSTRFIALPFNLFFILLGIFIVAAFVAVYLHKKRRA